MTGAERIRNMLLKDKLDLGEGFMRALKGDLNRVLSYYLTPRGECEVLVSPTSDGFAISISVKASGLKRIEAV